MKTLTTLFKNNVREYGMLIALIAVMAFFQFQTKGVLMKPVNIGTSLTLSVPVFGNWLLIFPVAINKKWCLVNGYLQAQKS